MIQKGADKSRLNEELKAICALVEQMYEGVICEWKGFAGPRSPTESEGIVLEVFFAPEGSGRALMRSTYQIREEIGVRHDRLVSLVVHYTAETIEFYLDDVLAVLSARYDATCTQSRQQRRTLLFDPAAFSAEHCEGKPRQVNSPAFPAPAVCAEGQTEPCWEQYGSSEPISKQTAAA